MSKLMPFVFGGILLIEALIFGFVAAQTVINDDPIFLLFPGVWAFFDGVTPVPILWFTAVTAISYTTGGVMLTVAYALLQKVISRNLAFVITVFLPIILFTGIAYYEYNQYKTFFHIGDTPADCARLDVSQRNWCYRTIYQRYPTAEVCLKLDGGEAMQCWQLCAASSNLNCENTPSMQGAGQTIIYEKKSPP